MRSDEVQVVIDRELQLLCADVRRSPQFVDELLDPDFREVGVSGRCWARGEIISALAAEPGSRIDVADMEGAVLSDDLVLITYSSHRDGRRARRCSLWRRSGTVWRVLYHQGTVVGET